MYVLQVYDLNLQHSYILFGEYETLDDIKTHIKDVVERGRFCGCRLRILAK